MQAKMFSLLCLIISGLTGSEANNLSVSQGGCWGPLLNNRYLYLYPDNWSGKQTLTLAQAQAECLTLSTGCGGVTSKPSSGYWEPRKGNTPMTSSSGEQSIVRCATDPCASLSCAPFGKCKINGNGQPYCQYCNDACPPPSANEKLCGSDGKTYDSFCLFDIAQCWSSTPLTVAYQGPCSPTPPGCFGPVRPNTYLYQYPDHWSGIQTLTLAQAQGECLTLATCGGVTSKPSSGYWEPRKGTTPNNSPYGESSYVRQNKPGCTGGALLEESVEGALEP